MATENSFWMKRKEEAIEFITQLCCIKLGICFFLSPHEDHLHSCLFCLCYYLFVCIFRKCYSFILNSGKEMCCLACNSQDTQGKSIQELKHHTHSQKQRKTNVNIIICLLCDAHLTFFTLLTRCGTLCLMKWCHAHS